jgi:internalin A
VKKAAPYLKFVGTTLSLVLPVASSALKLSVDEATFKEFEDQLDFGKECLEATVEGGEKVNDWLGQSDSPKLEHADAVRAQGAILRELHALVKKQGDSSFGGLVRVRNKRQEFLWVHQQFEAEY